MQHFWTPGTAATSWPSPPTDTRLIPRATRMASSRTRDGAFFPVFPFLLRAAGVLTGLPVEILVPALNGLAALLAMTVLYIATRRFVSRAMATAVVALVATSMAMPVWTLAYSDTLGLLGVVVALALLATRRYAWLAVILTVLAVTRPVMAPLAVVVALDSAYIWRRSTTPYPRGCPGDDDLGGHHRTDLACRRLGGDQKPPHVMGYGSGIRACPTSRAPGSSGRSSPVSGDPRHPARRRAPRLGRGACTSDGLSVRPARLARRLPGVPRRGHVHLGLSRPIPAVALSRRSAAGRSRPVTLRAGHPGRLLCWWGSPYSRPGLSSSSSLRRV